MTYKLRDDVVLESINNINVFIALKPAWNSCPFILQVAPITAFFWTCIKNNMQQSDIIQEGMIKFDLSEELVIKSLQSFLRAAQKMNYLISGDTIDDKEQ